MIFAVAEKVFAAAKLFSAIAKIIFATAEIFSAVAEKTSAIAENSFAVAEKLPLLRKTVSRWRKCSPQAHCFVPIVLLRICAQKRKDRLPG